MAKQQMTRELKLIITSVVGGLIILVIALVLVVIFLNKAKEREAIELQSVYNLSSKLALERCRKYETITDKCDDMDVSISRAECVGDCWSALYTLKDTTNSKFYISIWVERNGKNYRIGHYFDPDHQ